MTTFTEQFATEYARNAVPSMLKAIDTVKRYNRLTLIGALITSYLHQAHYLATQGAGLFAYLPPAIFDTAMVSMLVVVRTHGIARDAKRPAMLVFIGAALLSATVNFVGGGNLSVRIIFALVVVLVIGVELVAGRIRPDFAAIDKQAAELLSAANKIKAADTTVTNGTADITTATTPAAGQPANPAPAPDTTEPTVQVPAHLLPTARFAAVQHEQTTGVRITEAELAARIGVAPLVAAQLLAVIHDQEPAPARINGHTPALSGGPR